MRFTANDTGDITFAANTLMTAGPPATPTQIANVQNGIGTKLNNNDFTMTYVDIDGDASTFNSSTSQLLMPSGSEVLFAGLYWGGRTNSTFPTGLTSQRDAVKFKAPGDSGYRDLTGKTVGTSSSSYQSFYDVTAIVEAAGDGAYTVANVRSITNSSDYYAGWSIPDTLLELPHQGADVAARRSKGRSERGDDRHGGQQRGRQDDQRFGVGLQGSAQRARAGHAGVHRL